MTVVPAWSPSVMNFRRTKVIFPPIWSALASGKVIAEGEQNVTICVRRSRWHGCLVSGFGGL
jgi:hypothetical protein